MLIAQLPTDEELRLLDLHSLDLLHTPSEEEYDEIVELAAQLCNCPVSLITLLDKDQQWFKAKHGIAVSSTPRHLSFCSHAILQDGLMVVNDSRLDSRFSDNPLVTGETKVVFYAGAPILSPNGYKIGTICIIDHQPREISKEERRALQILSNQVTRLIELRHWNTILKTRANELLSMKDVMVRQVIQDQDDDKRNIAVELHENLAQTLAASRMFLSLAEQNETMRLPLVKSTNDQLGQLLISMRDLSNSITPATIASIPIQELLSDYVKKSAFPFEVVLEVSGDRRDVLAELSLTCFRIIEKWLEQLKERSDIRKVTIRVKLESEIQLSFEDDGQILDFKEREEHVILSSVYDRVLHQGGRIQFPDTGCNTLHIYLPYEKPVLAA